LRSHNRESCENRFRNGIEVASIGVICDIQAHDPWPGIEKGLPMATNPSADQMVGVLRETVVSLVRRDGPDLSARQLGVFLTCYLRDGGHTVRGLAAELNVSKPAITRALDRLGELDLARRKVDPLDRRSVLVQRTLKGAAFLRDLRSIMGEAATTMRRAPNHEPAQRRATTSA
jgi:DNA-binding MarR family transcriptional regulator